MTCPHKTSPYNTSANFMQTFVILCKSLNLATKPLVNQNTSHLKVATLVAWQTAIMQANFKVFVKKVKSSKNKNAKSQKH